MSEDWQAVRAEVADAIASIEDVAEPAKAKVTLIQAGPQYGNDYDPIEGAKAMHTVNALISMFEAKEIDGTLIQTDDVKITIPADGLSVEPSTADTIEADGPVKYEIMDVMPLKPAGIVLMWALQCRKH